METPRGLMVSLLRVMMLLFSQVSANTIKH